VAVFLGTHHPKLDDKGRLFLPARFREALAGGLVMTKGQEHCLFVFARDVFEEVAAGMQSAPLSSRAARDYTRVFLAGASDEIPDRQGRVTIPAPLREYAGLSKDCVVIGTGRRLEIWDRSSWESYLEAKEPEFAELSEEVLPGLL
jgi:MraZ protein